MWQDYVFAIGTLLLSIGLFRSGFDRATRVSRWTSVSSMLVLYAFAYAQWSLDLRVTCVLTLIQAKAWFLIALIRGPKQ